MNHAALEAPRVRPTGIDKEELRRRFDLVDFIGGYVRLRPAGNGRYCGCCPFHKEDTPSFYVFESQTYKCFGCNAGGDIFRFVQDMERLSFTEAKALLSRGGSLSCIPVQAPPRRRPVKPETTWQQEMARSQLGALVDSPGQAYLLRRGISYEVAHDARVRFAASWYGRPSVIFPIKGQSGDVVAVQGRAIRGDKKITKGPKSQGVFVTGGAFKDGVFAEGLAICEAPIDALSLLMLYGLPAIATCGSGLPVWLPKACRDSVWIATDADKQGDADFDAWAPLLEAERLTVKRLRPKAKDWNDQLLSTAIARAA